MRASEHGYLPCPMPLSGQWQPSVLAGRAPAGKPKSPERVFAAEIERGELPSLRQVKERMHAGTDRARVIRDQLAEVVQAA